MVVCLLTSMSAEFLDCVFSLGSEDCASVAKVHAPTKELISQSFEPLDNGLDVNSSGPDLIIMKFEIVPDR